MPFVIRHRLEQEQPDGLCAGQTFPWMQVTEKEAAFLEAEDWIFPLGVETFENHHLYAQEDGVWADALVERLHGFRAASGEKVVLMESYPKRWVVEHRFAKLVHEPITGETPAHIEGRLPMIRTAEITAAQVKWLLHGKLIQGYGPFLTRGGAKIYETVPGKSWTKVRGELARFEQRHRDGEIYVTPSGAIAQRRPYEVLVK